MTVHNIVHHHHAVKEHPLKKPAPPHLTFTEFIPVVECNMKTDTKFQGFAFETEPPEILEQLPNSSLNIKRKLVF